MPREVIDLIQRMSLATERRLSPRGRNEVHIVVDVDDEQSDTTKKTAE